MKLQVNQENRDRMKSMAGVAAFHSLIGWAFLTGLGFELGVPVDEKLKMFNVVEPPPPPPAVPMEPEKVKVSKLQKPRDPEGAAAPPNLKDTPTEVMAPKPKIVIPVPPPIVVAPAAGQGNAPAAGATEVPGPGTGRGGIGDGLGSGMYGTGTGGGGGGMGMARPTRARLIRGRIYDTDYPTRAYAEGIEGTVYMRFVVTPEGSVRDCAVTRSSGSRDLDRVTCRLIEQRFRYRPARDAEGRPIAEVIRGEQRWELGDEPPPREYEADIPDD